jgi:hypothetical protein
MIVGYLQCLCENGHYFEYYLFLDIENNICPHCKTKSSWINEVDTADHEEGYVPIDFLVVLNNTTNPFIYKIPTKEETNKLRTKINKYGKRISLMFGDI